MPIPVADVFPQKIHTERLDLELFTFTREQFTCWIDGMNGPQALALQGDFNAHTPADCMRYYNAEQLLGPPASIRGSGPLYFARLRATGELVGMVSLAQRATANGGVLPPDIGWLLLETHFKQGLATEAARGFLRYLRDEIGLVDISVLVNERNGPSNRVAERLGFQGGNQVFIEDEKMWAPLWVLPHMGKLDIKGSVDLMSGAHAYEKAHGKWDYDAWQEEHGKWET